MSRHTAPSSACEKMSALSTLSASGSEVKNMSSLRQKTIMRLARLVREGSFFHFLKAGRNIEAST